MLFQPRCPVERQGHRQQDTMYHKKENKKKIEITQNFNYNNNPSQHEKK